MINKNYKTVKKIIRKKLLPDIFTTGKYSFSPYAACEHGCIYCDGRAEKYYIEGDFEKDIIIRENLVEQLNLELPKFREKGTITIGSGVSDAYQPVELSEKIMSKALVSLKQYDNPVYILTKSSLIKRDIEIINDIHKKNGFCLAVSIGTIDDNKRKIFEPKSSSIERRLDIIQLFKKRGIPVGILAMPLIPLMTDNEIEIRNLFSKLKEIGVDFIIPGPLTLRPGRQKDFFINKIKKHYPVYKKSYDELYSSNLQSGAISYPYRKDLNKKLINVFNEVKIPSLIPFNIYKNHLPAYDSIFILLSHMSELFYYKGINVTNLQKSLKMYTEWLLKEKKHFNRKRSIPAIDLENKIFDLINHGEINKIILNKKLSDFLYEIYIKKNNFNYVTLKLD